MSRYPSSRGRLRGRRGGALRATVLQAFAYKCAWCGAEGVPLEVHHLDHNHTNNDFANLSVLCRSCHTKAGMRLI